MLLHLFLFYTMESYTDRPTSMFLTNCEIPLFEKFAKCFKNKIKSVEI